jgi:hypothetical protein
MDVRAGWLPTKLVCLPLIYWTEINILWPQQSIDHWFDFNFQFGFLSLYGKEGIKIFDYGG